MGTTRQRRVRRPASVEPQVKFRWDPLEDSALDVLLERLRVQQPGLSRAEYARRAVRKALQRDLQTLGLEGLLEGVGR